MGQGREEDTLAVLSCRQAWMGQRREGGIGRSYRVGKRGWVKEERKIH